MKGIILGGGSGKRLQPATLAINKQLLPVYDKPMIYHPLSVLMLADIREVLIISSPESSPTTARCSATAPRSTSISAMPSIRARRGWRRPSRSGATSSAGSRGADPRRHIFFDAGPAELCASAARRTEGGRPCSPIGWRMRSATGVVEFDAEGCALSLEEKPAHPKSPYAVTGLYLYDNRVVELAAALRPPARGEYEIIDLNRLYMDAGALYVERTGRGYAWLDTGTHDSLLEASEFVRTIQHRQGIQIACLEEIAYLKNFITREAAAERGRLFANTAYGRAILAALD